MNGDTFPPFGRWKSFYWGNLWQQRRISFLCSFSPQGLGKSKEDLRGRNKQAANVLCLGMKPESVFSHHPARSESCFREPYPASRLAWSGLGGGGAVHPTVFLSCHTPVSQMLTPCGVHRSVCFVVRFEPNTSSARVDRRTVQRMCAESERKRTFAHTRRDRHLSKQISRVVWNPRGPVQWAAPRNMCGAAGAAIWGGLCPFLSSSTSIVPSPPHTCLRLSPILY